MKKITIAVVMSAVILVCGLGVGYASPTLDGTLDATQYTLAFSTTTQARVGFSVGTCDCSAIYYAYDANSVYFFVQGRIDGTGNGMILMVGSSATAGYPAGYNLGNTNTGNGVFSLGAGNNGNWEMDFPVNVGIYINAYGGLTPSGSNLFYVNDAIYFNASSFATSGYMGGISANGGVLSTGTAVSKASVSYNNSGNSSGPGNSTGLEVAFPRVGSALGTLTTGVKLQAFAIIISQTGYFDDDGVPTNFPAVFGDNLNFGASTIDNPGPNHITTAALGSYTWNTTFGIYTIATNWSPVRNSPATDDSLTFNGSLFSLSSVTAVPTQSIGQLNVINMCTAIFTANVGATVLSVGTSDVSNPALFVASSSQLIFGGINGITLALNTAYVGGAWSLGTVNGDLVHAQTNAVTMALTSLTTNGVVFTSGASFQDAPVANITINPFNGSTVNSVVFQSGATFYGGGTKTAYSIGSTGDPFFSTRPASIVNFLSGSSTYWWNPNINGDSFGGRTSGYLIFNNQIPGLSTPGSSGNGTIVAQNDMIFKGTATSQLTTLNQGGIYVGGNFIVESGSPGFADAELRAVYPVVFQVLGNFSCAGTFIPNTSANGAVLTWTYRLYALTGTSPQTLMLNSSLPLLSNLSINNSGGGIVMESNVSVLSTLYMVNGNITTGSYTLSLGTSVSNGCGVLNRTTGTIIGNFARYVPAGSSGVDFPVGTANSFNDASVVFTGGGATTAGILTTTFTSSNPGTNGLPLTDGTLVLDTVNIAGYWTINGNATTGGTDKYKVVLKANGFTFAGVTANASIVYRTNSSSAWTLVGNEGANNTTQFIRSAIPNSIPFGDYAIAESNLPPSAGFTATPSSGNGPLAVTFVDTSLNLPTSWNWNFGDGSITGFTSSSATTHTYAAVGAPTTYTVWGSVTNSFGTSSSMGTVTVTEAGPSASFSATSTSGYGPVQFQFNDGSSYPTSSAYTTWAWNFGDGVGTSSLQNPTYTYAAVLSPTQYTVQLIVTTPFGMTTSTRTNYISVNEASPFSNYTVIPNSGYGPYTATFIDTSVYPASSFTTFEWIFGDGSTSGFTSSTTTTHLYTTVSAPTTYTSWEIVSTSFGVNSSSQAVTVLSPVSFSVTPNNGDGPYTATFVDTSINPTSSFTTFEWIFGDGSTSGFTSSTTTTYQYQAVSTPTTYTAWEIVSTSFGVGSSSQVVSVGELPPVVNFTVNPNSGSGPYTATFVDTSVYPTSSFTTFEWIFGDGGNTGFTTSTSTTYLYGAVLTPTTYTAWEIVSTSFGVSSSSQTVSVSESAPTVSFSVTPNSGNGPFTPTFVDTSNYVTSTYTTFKWIFGDGVSAGFGTSTATTHQYNTVSAPTTYTAWEIVSTSFGVSSSSQSISVNESAPTVSFSVTPNSGNGPFTPTFVDTSNYVTSTYTTFKWVFGDGASAGFGTSTTTTHQYNAVSAPTTYTAWEIVSTSFGVSSSSHTVSVTESGPLAAFSPSVASGFGALTVSFTDESNNLNGSSTTWSWKFGDGQVSSVQSPTHDYATVAAPTSYTVQLIVTTNFGMSTATTVISVTEPPPSAFSLLMPLDNLTTNIHQQLFSWSTSTDVGSSIIITCNWEWILDLPRL
jgi:PKD repeat protein